MLGNHNEASGASGPDAGTDGHRAKFPAARKGPRYDMRVRFGGNRTRVTVVVMDMVAEGSPGSLHRRLSGPTGSSVLGAGRQPSSALPLATGPLPAKRSTSTTTDRRTAMTIYEDEIQPGDVVEWGGCQRQIVRIDLHAGWAWPIAVDACGWAIALGHRLVDVRRSVLCAAAHTTSEPDRSSSE